MVRVTVLDKRSGGVKNEVKKIADKVLKILKNDSLGIDFYIISAQRSIKLNKEWRQQDKPASVLSFPPVSDFLEEGKSAKMEGEVYISPSYLKSQGYELKLIVAHSILHLLGYTHQTKLEAKKMEKAEDKILVELAGK